MQSQLSPGVVVNGGPNMVTMMQYDQLVNTARSMKEENNMLKGMCRARFALFVANRGVWISFRIQCVYM